MCSNSEKQDRLLLLLQLFLRALVVVVVIIIVVSGGQFVGRLRITRIVIIDERLLTAEPVWLKTCKAAKVTKVSRVEAIPTRD